MAISRPFLLAVLGVALLGATVLAVANARDRADGGAPTGDVAEASGPGPTEPAAQLGPEEALGAALSPGQVRSASFRARLAASAQGAEELSLRVDLSGSFEDRGDGEAPAFELDMKARAEGPESQSFDLGVVSTGDRAFITRGEVGYRIPAELWDPIAKALSESGAETSLSLPLDVDPRAWLGDLKLEGTERIDGVEATHVSASIDVAKALKDLMAIAGDSAQVPGGAALPPGLEESVARAVERAELDLLVGSDRILRRLTLDVGVTLPEELRAGAGGVESATIELELELSEVNDPQRIEAPEQVRSELPGGPFGESVRGVLQVMSLATGSPGSVDAGLAAGGDPRSPGRLRRAVRDGRKAVVFFHQGALDDRATAPAVRALDRRGRTLVLTDRVENSDRYGELIERLGVSQAPAIVIVDRDGEAHLIEGYVDAAVLAQEVADAR